MKSRLPIWAILFSLILFQGWNGGLRAQEIAAYRGRVPDGYNFWLYTPPSYKVDSLKARTPLVVFLHGRSLCGTNLYSVLRYGSINAIQMGREIDALIVAPQNPGGAWNPDKILHVIDWVQEKCPCDTARVYVLGMSLGGYGTMDFVDTYPDRVAAAMALCGGSTHRTYENMGGVPLWVIHGTADTAVPIRCSDTVVQWLRDNHQDMRVLYDRLEGYNHSSLAKFFYMPMTYDWLFSHSLTTPGRPVTRIYGITEEDIQDAYKDFDKDFRATVTIVDPGKL